MCDLRCFVLDIFSFNWSAGRNGSSNNKSGSLRRGQASASENGFAKSLGTTIGFNYSSPVVQVCMYYNEVFNVGIKMKTEFWFRI